MEPGKQNKILVVEDDPNFCELLRQLLRTRSYAVETARSGLEGIGRAKQLLPQGIILDFRLPDMNAVDFCTSLKEFSQTRTIPVMVVSGFQKHLGDTEMARLGIHHYLEKPFKNSEFLQMVHNMVSAKLLELTKSASV
jgi:CheY-like chemotaxis protein